jgi:hypothetical protein
MNDFDKSENLSHEPLWSRSLHMTLGSEVSVCFVSFAKKTPAEKFEKGLFGCCWQCLEDMINRRLTNQSSSVLLWINMQKRLFVLQRMVCMHMCLGFTDTNTRLEDILFSLFDAVTSQHPPQSTPSATQSSTAKCSWRRDHDDTFTLHTFEPWPILRRYADFALGWIPLSNAIWGGKLRVISSYLLY